MDTQLLTPPAIVGRVVQLAKDPDSSAADIGKVISQDPAISVRLLHAVNSAYYSLRSEVTSIEQAVGYMGLRAVRNLVLCVGLRQMVAAKDLTDFPIENFWECSLRRATAARSVAERLGMPQAEELFTLGLCQDFAVLVELRDKPKLCHRFATALSRPAPQRLASEQEAGVEGHDIVGHALLSSWGLPAELAEPIRFHHSPTEAPEQYRRSAQIAHCAEILADLFCIEDRYKRSCETIARGRLEDLGLDGDVLPELIDDIGVMVHEVAEMLEVTISEQPDYAEIAAAAAEGLFELNLSYEATAHELQNQLTEQQRVSSQLQTINEKLEQRVFIDELTGLANRRAFDEQLTRNLAVASRESKPLSLLLVDVDHFKRINDTHGHQAGDRVLKRIGEILAGLVRRGDLAARYGGEEFAMILPFANEEGAKGAAERVRQALGQIEIEWDDLTLKITASVGGITVDTVTNPDIGNEVVRAADKALYEAKESGRNCVRWGAR